MLRIRGEIALLPHGDGPAAVEKLFTSAVDQAHRQKVEAMLTGGC